MSETKCIYKVLSLAGVEWTTVRPEKMVRAPVVTSTSVTDGGLVGAVGSTVKNDATTELGVAS